MATDKRLDQVSQFTDFDYALIVKGTDVAKVTKQQLAELVGNLLYGATTKETLASVVAGQTLGSFNKIEQKNVTITGNGSLRFAVNKWSIISIYDTSFSDKSGLYQMSGSKIEALRESYAVSQGWLTLTVTDTNDNGGIVTVTNTLSSACNFYYCVFA